MASEAVGTGSIPVGTTSRNSLSLVTAWPDSSDFDRAPFPATPSTRPKLTVSGVAQSRHDVAVCVQVVVNGSQVNGHIRMSLPHDGNPLRRTDQTDELDLLHLPALDDEAQVLPCMGESHVPEQSPTLPESTGTFIPCFENIRGKMSRH